MVRVPQVLSAAFFASMGATVFSLTFPFHSLELKNITLDRLFCLAPYLDTLTKDPTMGRGARLHGQSVIVGAGGSVLLTSSRPQSRVQGPFPGLQPEGLSFLGHMELKGSGVAGLS